MAQYLENTDKFFWTRKSRFPDQFLGDIRAMVNSTVSEITGKFEVRFAKFIVTYVFVSPFCGRSFGDGRVVVIIFKPKYQYASKKRTYPSPNLTLTPTSNQLTFVDLWEG